jgi:GntR family transcriptional repressor for pyruvate dehydrogenase complex
MTGVRKIDTPPERRRGLPIIYKPGGNLRPIRDPEAAAVVSPPKASATVAASIVRDIVDSDLRVGDRLPAETEMLAHYGVSRESLREGLRMLEVQGLISIRRGPGGGPYVAPVNASYLARTASMYFNLSGATYDEIFDTWLDFEPVIAAKVARIPDRRLKRAALAPFLDEEHPHAGAHEHFEDLNNFHATLGSLAGNRVTTLLVQSVTHIVVDHVIEDVDPLEIPNLDDEHGDIAQAIIDGRARKARDLMHDHIAAVVAYYRKYSGDHMETPIAWR